MPKPVAQETLEEKAQRLSEAAEGLDREAEALEEKREEFNKEVTPQLKKLRRLLGLPADEADLADQPTERPHASA